MKNSFPQFVSRKINSNEIIFTGDLKVAPLIPIYTVEIHYNRGITPTVKILKPRLDEGAKHLYADGSLCLFHPHNFKWKEDFAVAKYIVGYTAGWIYFHETWLQTGIWYGPEAQHG